MSSKFVTIDNVPQPAIDLMKQKYKVLIPTHMNAVAHQYKAFMLQAGVVDMIKKAFSTSFGEVTLDEGLMELHPVADSIIDNPVRLLQ